MKNPTSAISWVKHKSKCVVWEVDEKICSAICLSCPGIIQCQNSLWMPATRVCVARGLGMCFLKLVRQKARPGHLTGISSILECPTA